MKQDGNCCTGTAISTPASTENRPGLSAIRYRIGTYTSFFDTMRARLSSTEFPELAALKTRAADDPAIALLDAWAVSADVLSFYQERLANEAYLATATERRSVVELARLIGYQPRPGVSASVYLAYEMDANATEQEILPPNTRAQSVPGPGEQMQTFETAEPLTARAEWNTLKLRMSQPPRRDRKTILQQGLYFQGTATLLKANDALLIDFGDGKDLESYRVSNVHVDIAANRTKVELRPWASTATRKTIQEIAQRYISLGGFEVFAGNGTAQNVLEVLESLRTDDQKFKTTAELVTFLQKPLSALETELVRLTPDSSRRPWITGIIEELKSAHQSLLDRVAQETSIAVGTAIAPTNRDGRYKSLIGTLITPPSVPPRNELRLTRDIGAAFAEGGEIFPQLLQASLPSLADSLYGALANTAVTKPVPIKVYTLRVKAALFANNAPNPLVTEVVKEGSKTKVKTESLNLGLAWRGLVPAPSKEEGLTFIGLDAPYEQIKPDNNVRGRSDELASYVLMDWPIIQFANSQLSTPESLAGTRMTTIHKITQVNTTTMTAGMFTVKVTQLGLDKGWLAESPVFEASLKSELLLRGTQVYAQSELLELADDPIEDDICDHFPKLSSSTHEIELDGLYDGLKPGRWLIVSGQRTDVPGTTSTPGAERVMLAGVRHGVKQVETTIEKKTVPLNGDKLHTFITLAKPLAYCYKRNTVTIHGNVVRADHGETRRETLGSGDGRQAFQSFSLRQPPLTFVAASSPEGISSTLEMRVNGVRWHEVDALLNLAPGAQGYITRRDDDEKTSVIFGGNQGARLPTGQENIQAIYRNGIGRGGNVRALQISLATDKPRGVKGVSNPLRASGGADRDSHDQARRNAPLAVMALDRLVSVQDYADFARTFAGIGKAVATRLADGRRQLVHVTIAGVDDVPIDLDSDLYRNLVDALRRNGDPHLPVQVQTRTLRPLVIYAKVAIAPEYPWEVVAPKIRATLLDAFGFERRELGQDVLKSTVIAAIQSILGVRYSVVEIAALTEDQIITHLQRQVPPDTSDKAKAASTLDVFGLGSKTNDPLANPNIAIALASATGQIRPAELAYLLPTVPETLLLELQA